MNYIVCVSTFHLMMAEAIKAADSNNRYIIVDVRRYCEFRNLAPYLTGRLTALIALTRCAFGRDSHAIVSHPFNLWFSLFMRSSSKISHFDDGIAYYYAAKTPQGIFPGIYALIGNVPYIKELGRITYIEYLRGSAADTFYCLFPTLLVGKIKARLLPITPPVRCRDSKCDEGTVVFLDSTPTLVRHFSVNRIVEILERVASETVSGCIYFKRHPAAESPITRKLRAADWAIEITGAYEIFVSEHKVDRLYSIYSSANLSTYLLSPETKLFCFTNNVARNLTAALENVFEILRVNYIHV